MTLDRSSPFAQLIGYIRDRATEKELFPEISLPTMVNGCKQIRVSLRGDEYTLVVNHRGAKVAICAHRNEHSECLCPRTEPVSYDEAKILIAQILTKVAE